ELLLTPGAVRAALTWPHFSVTSFLMVRRLRLQGVVPATVIDVGANVGQFAVACARTFPACRILSFEPGAEAFARLERHTRGLAVSCRNVALGSSAGVLPVRRNRHSGASSFLPMTDYYRARFPDLEEEQVEEVRVELLDAALADEELVGPILLKLDVQGFEKEVLAGGERTLSGCRWVLMELSFHELYRGEETFVSMIDYMRERGFALDRLVDVLREPARGEIVQADALFVPADGEG
ncbi:MAG: FkbM family methyltransferase, partial [Gemmatimonadetes bacterium]